MAKGRGPDRRRNKSKGAETAKEINVAQAQRMAPMLGLKDVLAPGSSASTGMWQQFMDHVETEGKREQREDLEAVMRCLETRD